jgi:hypothetical protein
MLCEKLKVHVAVATATSADYRSVLEQLSKRKLELMQQSAAVKRQIMEASNKLQLLITTQSDALEIEMTSTKEQILKEIKDDQITAEREMSKLQSLIDKCEKLADEGKPINVVKEYRDLQSAAIELESTSAVIIHGSVDAHGDKEKEIEFVTMNLESYLPRSRQNLLGRLKVLQSKQQKVTDEDDGDDVSWNELQQRLRDSREQQLAVEELHLEAINELKRKHSEEIVYKNSYATSVQQDLTAAETKLKKSEELTGTLWIGALFLILFAIFIALVL